MPRYEFGAAVVVVAWVEAAMSVPFHGLPLAGNGTNLPFLICMNHPQLFGCALPNYAALISTGLHARPAWSKVPSLRRLSLKFACCGGFPAFFKPSTAMSQVMYPV